MSESSKLLGDTTQPQAVNTGFSADFKLTPENILVFYQSLALEAARQKDGVQPSAGIDIARMVLPKLLKYFKALLINEQPLTRAQLSLLQSQLELLKRRGLFEQAGLDAQVVRAIEEGLMRPEALLLPLFSSEQDPEDKTDFILLLEDLTTNPQPIEINNENNKPTAEWQLLTETSPQTESPLQAAELIKIEAEKNLRIEINTLLLDLNNSFNIETYLSKLLKQESRELTLLKVLAAKPKDDFRFDAQMKAFKKKEIEFLETSLLDEFTKEILEQETIGINLILLGNGQSEHGEFLSAIETFRLALQIFYHLHDRQNLDIARSNLVSTLIDYGYDCLEKNESEKAIKICQETLKLIGSSFQASIEEVDNLASIHNIYSIALHQAKAFDEALQYSQIEQALRVQLSSMKKTLDPALSTAKENLLKILIDKAKFHCDNKEFNSAALACQTLNNIFCELPFTTVDDDSLRKFTKAVRTCGLNFYAAGKYQLATDCFLLEIKVRENLSQSQHADKQENTNARRSLISASLAEADQFYSQGASDKALMVCQQALTDGSDKILPKTPADKLKCTELFSLLGLSYFALQNFKQAAQAFENELKLLNQLAMETKVTNLVAIDTAQNNLMNCRFSYIMKAFHEKDFSDAVKDAVLLTKIPTSTLFVTAENKNLFNLQQGCLSQLVRALINQADKNLKNEQIEETLYVCLVGILSLNQNQRQDDKKVKNKLSCLSEKFYQALDQLITKAQAYLNKNQHEEASKTLEKVNQLVNYIKNNPNQSAALLQDLGTSQLRLAKIGCELAAIDFNEGLAQKNKSKLQTATKKYTSARDLLLELTPHDEEVKLLLKSTQSKITSCELSLALPREPKSPSKAAHCRLFHHAHAASLPTSLQHHMDHMKFISH